MLESDGDNTVNNHVSSTLGDYMVNNPGRSKVTKIGTDASCPKVNSITGPGHMYSDKSDTEIDTITTEELPGQLNLLTHPLPTDTPINQQQSNLDANDCDNSPSILHQQEQPLTRNNHASTFDIIKKPKVHQKVDFLPVGEIEWKVAEVILKAGKNSGNYENWLHIHFEIETVNCIDWKNNVQEWHLHDEGKLNQHKDVTEVSSSGCEETVLFSRNEMKML